MVQQKNKWLAGLLALVAVFGSASSVMAASDTAASTITDGITSMVASGGTVAIAALGIFVAVLAVRVIKKFARAGV